LSTECVDTFHVIVTILSEYLSSQH